ncbi:hypothetical protein Leryth_015966 [Lithospermum erythrorhizon]|nr:hypothetical protein Leryth_015966 [Lithospermum erythrorhizon]
MGGEGGGGEEVENLEYTPTWVVASVCTVIIAISLVAERLLHFAGKYLVNKSQRSLFQALQKVKEELMLLGFISLLLTVFQRSIVKICVPPHIMKHFLPCHFPKEASSSVGHASHNNQETVHHHRLLQAEESGLEYCKKWNKVPIISLESLHHLHIFIFVLAVVQVAFSALTIIRQWKNWEDSIKRDYYSGPQETLTHITLVREHEFIKNRFLGMGRGSTFLGWLQSFFKQFYGSLTRSDYHALRLGFVTLVIAVGTKLEHIIAQLAHGIAEKHDAIEGDLIVKPSNDHFWFGRPRPVWAQFLLYGTSQVCCSKASNRVRHLH